MIISQTTAYALRIVCELAALPAEERLEIRELAELTGLRREYAAKVVQSLRRIGIVNTRRGRGGGVCLRNCDDQSLWSLILKFENVRKTTLCFLGHHKCGEEKHCHMHTLWSDIRERLVAGLKAMRIKDFATPPRTYTAHSKIDSGSTPSDSPPTS